MIRLNKFLADCGVASRRKADEMIFEGHVKVNGRVITEMGFRVDPGNDFIKVNNKRVGNEKKVYIVMNKPEGVICTVSDEKERKTVIDLVKHAVKQRIYPVGRLDYNTSGCLILTNDGEWANTIIHPKFEIEKTYRVKIKGRIPQKAVERLARGIKIDDKFVKAKDVRVFRQNDENDTVHIVITRGMNHQIKKMLQAVGFPVVRLRRESVGKINVKGLDAGQWRYLSPAEIKTFSVQRVQKKFKEGQKVLKGQKRR